jgi:XapX domain-containing protein
LVTGLIVGLVFSSLKLPLPAPNVLPGVAGIIGIYLGGVLFEYLLKIIGR